MGAAPSPVATYITPEEYLEQETLAQERHEYYNGVIIPMAGSSITHNVIVGNLYFYLRSTLMKTTRKYTCFATDLRVWIPARNAYTYPDVLVIAGEPQRHNERDDTITNPVLVIEVLSESTRRYDRDEKFIGYRSLPSLHDYLLIDQAQCLVEQFTRVEETKWLLTEYHDMAQAVPLSFAADESITLPLQHIYEQVQFPSQTT